MAKPLSACIEEFLLKIKTTWTEQQQQLKKLGNIMHYLDKFNHNWSLHTPRALGQTALQSEPLERASLLHRGITRALHSPPHFRRPSAYCAAAHWLTKVMSHAPVGQLRELVQIVHDRQACSIPFRLFPASFLCHPDRGKIYWIGLARMPPRSTPMP